MGWTILKMRLTLWIRVWAGWMLKEGVSVWVEVFFFSCNIVSSNPQWNWLYDIANPKGNSNLYR